MATASRVTPTIGWRISIVRYDIKPARDFLAHPLNFRIHPQAQQKATKGSLDTLGWIDEVMVNLRTSADWPPGDRGVETMINGHLRVQLALREGEETPIPVKYVDLSPNDELTALAIFDELAAMVVKDKEKLAQVMHEAKPADAAVAQMLSEMAQKEGLYQGESGTEGLGEPMDGLPTPARPSLADRFIVPPFSVLDARQGYWQARKRQWLALGILSELGRGENALGFSEGVNERHADGTGPYAKRTNATPGGSPQDNTVKE